MGAMSVRFVKTESIYLAAEYLAEVLSAQLSSGKSVLWLVPGGSAIAVAAAVGNHLKDQPLDHLTVTLTDERYGPVGHADSNWRQLMAAGFNLPGANLLPVLSGASRQETTKNFGLKLEKSLAAADYSIGLFGIGADGHTAGILPHSPAVNATTLTQSYKTENFERITMTPPAIGKLDEAVAFALGPNKWPVLNRLTDTIGIAEQPAQALKQVSKLIVFSDYQGGKTG